MTAEMIGRYRVQRLLGKTDFAAAYLAHDDALQRRVLIKRLLHRSEVAGESNALFEDLLREGKLLAQLTHPAIVSVFDVGEHEGRPFIAVELVDGTKLRDVLATERMSLQRAVGLMAEFADGIHFLHRRGYSHLHIKPETLLVDSAGSPRIDGLSLAMHESERVKRSGRIAGTPYYMAPEQVAGDAERLGTHTDVWALGVILYEVLTGRRPFFGTDIRSVFEHVCELEPVWNRYKGRKQTNDPADELLLVKN